MHTQVELFAVSRNWLTVGVAVPPPASARPSDAKASDAETRKLSNYGGAGHGAGDPGSVDARDREGAESMPPTSSSRDSCPTEQAAGERGHLRKG